MIKPVNILLALLLLSACTAPAARPVPTATRRPAVVFPPTWTPTPGTAGTIVPSATPQPTRTLGPIATLAASSVITSAQGHFSLAVPQNWATQAGERQLLSGNRPQLMEYATYSAPGTAPQPAIFLFYKWPNGGPISNENAWEQAYAVAALAVKVCPMTLTQGGPIEIGGETGNYIGYQDGCGVQGELVGFVHEGVNYGILLEAPQPVWEEWQPVLRDIISTLEFQ